MKAQEIRATLQGNHNPKLIHCICSVAEELSAQKQEIAMLAESLDRTLAILLQLGAVTEQATNAVDDLKKMRGN